MDFSKFSDGDFQMKEWVNGALRAHKDTQTPIDVHASTLVMKLQLFIQEVNNSLEETSLQMVQNLPRVLRDVEAVRQEATLLREQMQIVREDIKRVETDTAHSMQTLVELDAIKKRMFESQSALQEADNWTTLSADVEVVFATHDIYEIAKKLVGMQQSLNVLHDVPDYEERKRFLESLKNRLEALVSPKLITAFNSRSLEEAKKCVGIFADIERSSQARNYYTGCHKTAIQQMWSALYNPAKPCLEYLSGFYDELLAKWHSEHAWCSQVFSDSVQLLASLFCQSLEGLSPSLAECLHTVVMGDKSNSQSLSMLLELRQTAQRFVKGLERAVSDGSTVHLYSLVETIHSPYCQLLVKYPSMETQALRHKLHSIELSFSGGVEESVSLVADSVPKIFSYCSESLEHCLQLTEGWGLNGLVKAFESMFSQYLSKLSSCVHQLRRGCGLDTNAVGESDEWANLQHAFRLIQCCGEMLLRTLTLNTQVCSVVVSCTSKLRTPANDNAPFGCYDYLSVYHPEEHTAVMELLVTVEKGGEECPLFVKPANQMQSLNEHVHKFAFDILFSRLKLKLSRVPQLKVWETGVTSPIESPRAITDDLPSFSLSPLPYITEIGDYLLTLPQQLEPFTSQDNPSLVHALKHGQLPFPNSESEVLDSSAGDEEAHPSDDWLGAVARGTMETYVDNVLLIPSLSHPASHQLVTDISYLCNVLAALGQNPSTRLTQLETLLKADQEKFLEYEKDSTVSRQLYQRVSKLRTW